MWACGCVTLSLWNICACICQCVCVFVYVQYLSPFDQSLPTVPQSLVAQVVPIEDNTNTKELTRAVSR